MPDTAWLPGYLNRIDEIPGWFTKLDARLFALLDEGQGDLLEIGCFMGKSAVALGHMLHDGDSLVVCDPFENVTDEHGQTGAFDGLTRSGFEANYLAHHPALPEIRQCYSTALDLGDRQFRFIHVDGSHHYDDVAADVDLAIRHLAPGGLAVFDDSQNFTYPGTIAAVWSAVGDGRLRPLVVTKGKLYATTGDSHDIDQIKARLRATGIDADTSTQIHGRSVIVASAPARSPRRLERWVPEAMVGLAYRVKRRLR